MIRHLTLPVLLRIAEGAIAGDVLVRDHSLLESALARPRTTLFGHDAFPTLHGKAGALLHSLCSNHALVDGNKRLAAAATAVFLDINGAPLTLTEDELVDLIVAVADGSLDEVGKIADRLAGNRNT